MAKFDIAIIGAGILGTTISYWISSLYDCKICLIDKEPEVAMHASSRNTGVVHSPFYLNPDTKKILAKSATISYNMWEKVAKERNIPWKKTGVFEIGFNETQHKTLEEYMKWGIQNGLQENDLEILDGKEIAKREPNVKCYSGIFCKKEVASDFGKFTKEVKKESQKNGVTLLLGKNVKIIDNAQEITTMFFDDDSSIDARFVINCAGGNCLDIAKQFGLAKEYSDLHFRGEYWIADDKYKDFVKTTIYTVAEFKGYPFLDPHWIRRADGQSEIGPNAVPVPSPETYSGYLGDIITSLSKLKDIISGNALKLLKDPEFLSMVKKEWVSSISKKSMVSRVEKFIPEIKPEFFSKRGTAGIRSPIITPQGKFLADVIELENSSSYHIINYNSPGATGAPAYSAFVVQKLQEKGFLDYPRKKIESIWDYQKVVEQI